ncbi:LysR family transcriptional regulator [Lactobacillus sp. PV037]|uniref:LysR family transcriptional regulator n=1 Tax=unclassified Lactobacillus TaxID=2620435 RepID=UPI002240D344|nr:MULTISPECIES: LysR family transcriptional regulator [unclassified Lactobacillus]QNQ82246.1 LysR family transcriptional regulator [Lactobacillus sp. PV012]QNQ83643.1 LysR family transcriptional regulator [Lactobacillus sp. PV037]
MISFELLEELVTFAKYGTLRATAEHLMITQPSVTRGMQKLEQELGVKLFDRQANRISLNETGKLAAAEAKKLLAAENNFVEKIANFDQMKKNITIGSVAPGPLLWLDNNRPSFNQDLAITQQLITPDHVVQDLLSYKQRIIFTNYEIESEEIESMYLGREKLFVRIDKFNPLAAKKSVTFKDLAGLSFLVVRDVGPWRKIQESNIPDAKFLYQEDLNSLDELTQYSNFPVFRSNLTLASHFEEKDDDRILIPIEDKNNTLEIYGSYLKEQRSTVQPLLKEISQNWPVQK